MVHGVVFLVKKMLVIKEAIMPMVGKKTFPYTKKGKKAAEMYANKSKMKKKSVPKKKVMSK